MKFPDEAPFFRVERTSYVIAMKAGDIVEGTFDRRLGKWCLCVYSPRADSFQETWFCIDRDSSTTDLEPLTKAAREMLEMAIL